MKEYTLNHIRDPTIVYKVYSLMKGVSESLGEPRAEAEKLSEAMNPGATSEQKQPRP